MDVDVKSLVIPIRLLVTESRQITRDARLGGLGLYYCRSWGVVSPQYSPVVALGKFMGFS